MPKSPMLTAEQVRERFSYDRERGALVYNKTIPPMLAGSVAGKVKRLKSGYTYIAMKILGAEYSVHRVVWLYIYGNWPSGCIDHINRDSTDNRVENLRDVSKSQNKQNTLACKNNKIGVKGVYKVPSKNKWRAQIGINGKKVYLGTFDSVAFARQAYANAAARLHQFNPDAAK